MYIISKRICEYVLYFYMIFNLFRGEFYSLCILVLVFTIVTIFFPLNTQNQFICSLSFYGAYLIVEGVFTAIFYFSSKESFLIGFSKNFLMDCIQLLAIIILTICGSQFQKKVLFLEWDIKCSIIQQSNTINIFLVCKYQKQRHRRNYRRWHRSVRRKWRKKRRCENLINSFICRKKCNVCGKKLDNDQTICENCKITSV